MGCLGHGAETPARKVRLACPSRHHNPRSACKQVESKLPRPTAREVAGELHPRRAALLGGACRRSPPRRLRCTPHQSGHAALAQHSLRAAPGLPLHGSAPGRRDALAPPARPTAAQTWPQTDAEHMHTKRLRAQGTRRSNTAKPERKAQRPQA